MKNYAEMNDSQINILVCKAVGKGMSDYCRIMDMNDHTILLADNKTLFDPCNSWADAGPIIQDNAIGIMPFKKGQSEAWSLAAGLLSNTTVKHKNPLRATMIVFLMMNDHD